MRTEDGLPITTEEYFDYVFPGEGGAAPGLKLLEAAYRWKRQRTAAQQPENEDEEMGAGAGPGTQQEGGEGGEGGGADGAAEAEAEDEDGDEGPAPGPWRRQPGGDSEGGDDSGDEGRDGVQPGSRVKNKQPSNRQITAEQILREATEGE